MANKISKTDKKVGDYYLPQKVVKKMEQNLKLTDEVKVEHGFNLCLKSGSRSKKVYPADQCIGNTCEIRLSKGCESGDIRVGAYHTHPLGLPDLSLGDINIACTRRDVTCVGHGDKINCFTLKKFSDEVQEEKQLKHCALKSQIDGQHYEDKLRNIRHVRETTLETNLQLDNKLEELNKRYQESQTELKTEKEKVMKEYNKLSDSEVTMSKRYDNRVNKLTPKYFDKVKIK